MAPLQDDTQLLSSLTCPITLELFVDPVLADDGFTYERSAIVEWIEFHHGTSPMTRQTLKVKELKTNLIVKQLADQYRSSTQSPIDKESIMFSGGGTLLTKEQQIKLNGLFEKNKHWLLLYKASRDGFESADFHRLCDNRGPTLTIIQVHSRLNLRKRGVLFGGYTTVPWSSQDAYRADPQAFLFCLSANKATRFNLKASKTLAVIHNRLSGPIFGLNDIHICDRSNVNKLSYSRFPAAYADTDPNGKGRKMFVNSKYFSVRELEVYSFVM